MPIEAGRIENVHGNKAKSKVANARYSNILKKLESRPPRVFKVVLYKVSDTQLFLDYHASNAEADHFFSQARFF
jgi:hypothetical protein